MTGEWRGPGLLVSITILKNRFDRILALTAPIFSAPLIDYYLLPSLVVSCHCIVGSHHARRASPSDNAQLRSQAYQANQRLERAQHYALPYCCGVMTSQVSVIDCAAKRVGIMPGRTGECTTLQAWRRYKSLLPLFSHGRLPTATDGNSLTDMSL
jgi:hypothetical protein